MFGKKKQPKISDSNIRVLRIAKQDWTEDDMRISSKFVKSLTFGRMVAWCHEQLIKAILHKGENDDYRRGYMDAMKHISSFTKEPQVLEDSFETVSMQEIDE